MILLPFFFGFIFALLLIYKLVGGHIDWIYVIISGAFFIVPFIFFIFAWIRFNAKNKTASETRK